MSEFIAFLTISTHLQNQQLVKQLHLYCLNTFIQSRALAVEFPEMMSEVIAAQLPKILAGMVKPLLFHKKWCLCLVCFTKIESRGMSFLSW